MSVKIANFELENVKRIKLVNYTPTENGLTIIGGKNNQGKTSILDSIAWALGGDRFKPSAAKRDGALVPPHLTVTLSNGIVVERKGKNSDLKVTDPDGRLAGQQLLNRFIESFALNIPKFMESSGKDKAKILLKIIGVGDELLALEQKEVQLYDKRHTIGQMAEQKKNYAAEMISFPGMPDEPISAIDLIKEQQAILARNGENQKKRLEVERIREQLRSVGRQIEELEAKLDGLKNLESTLNNDLMQAEKTTEQLHDESTTELEESIRNIEEINRKVRANLDKLKAESEAEVYMTQYGDLSREIDRVRRAKIDLLKSADLPLDELFVEDGELVYNGKKWDSMSASEQLRVSTAIVRKLNPECGFVLLDKLEQFDLDTLEEFGKWLEAEGLQAIATRVSTGDECSIVIEDGYIKTESKKEKDWGEF